MTEDLDKEPAGIAARALGQSERLLAAWAPRLHADDIGDVALQARVEVDEKAGRLRRRPIDRREPARKTWTEGLNRAIRRDLGLQRRVIAEGKGLGRRLQKEVEWIGDRQIGDKIDLDDQLPRLLGKNEARLVVRLRILLPVDEMVFRSDRQGIAQDWCLAVRRRPQAKDLRPQRDQAIVAIDGAMMQRDMYRHGIALDGRKRGAVAAPSPLRWTIIGRIARGLHAGA